MLVLIERTRQAVERYLRESPPFIVDLAKVAELYRSFPTLVKGTPGVDGEYAQTLISTARENVEALATWKSYCVDFQNSAQTALRMLSDKGDEGFLAHVNRVPDVLEAAITAR